MRSTQRSSTCARALALATLLASALSPATGRAGDDVLLGFSAGGVYQDGAGPPALAFRIGFGADWLFDSGLSFLGRLETTHLLDSTAFLALGWSGSGLLRDQGLPLGVGVGPTLSIDRTADVWTGGRWVLRWSLWYARAVLELDGGLRRRLAPNARSEDDALEFSLGLSLRLVPF